jgi:hypothetical protein
MATISFKLATVGTDAPLYLPTETNALTPTSFVAHVGDQLLIVDSPQQKVTPTGAGTFVPVSPAVAGAPGSGQTFWIAQDALTQEPASSSSSAILWVLLAAGIAYLVWGDEA